MRYLDTIGIVGGMGSYATLDFFRRLLRAFPAEKEWDRPRILIDNRCTMPSRVRAILYQEERPALVRELAAAARGLLSCRADWLVFACSTSHVFLEDVFAILPEAREKTIHMIDTLACDMHRAGVTSACLLASEGTIQSGIYPAYFERYGIALRVPEESALPAIRHFIELVKQDRSSEQARREFAALCREAACENVILGCTELPLLVQDAGIPSVRLWDPLESAIARVKRVIQ